VAVPEPVKTTSLAVVDQPVPVATHTPEPKPDDQLVPDEPAPIVSESPVHPPAHPKRRWYRSRWFYVALVILVILLTSGGLVWYKLASSKHVPAVVAKITSTPTPTPTPTIIYDSLTGLPVASTAAAADPVVGVMIENLFPNARPQSGLGQAGVVYEALAEGGITRFLAIFQEPLPVSLGPVRSLRPYYLDWGLEYGIPIAHAGGSQPALAEVPELGLKDINALVYDGSYFFRTTDRAAPHNLYTNSTLLPQLVTKLGFATAPTFQALPRKSDAPQATPSNPVININFSSSEYAVQYNYVAASDKYLRDMGGVAHIDRNTGQQISVKNIVVEFVPTTYSTQDDGKPETDMNLIGQGRTLVFEDGGVITGTWNKSSAAAQTQLLDTTGKPIQFNRGNTWYEVVPTNAGVSY
jgi:hypothetical protein